MAAYVERLSLTSEQRKGLKWFASHPPGSEIAGIGPFVDGSAFATAVLQVLGDKGYAAREGANVARRSELFAVATNPTTKATIEATITSEFTDDE